MIQLAITRRRYARQLGLAVAALSVAMVTIVSGIIQHGDASAAATDQGTVSFTVDGAPTTGGGSLMVFSMNPPQGAACPGSGAQTPPYRWQSFLVDDAVNVSALTYSSGPNAVTGHFVSALYDSAGGNPVQNQNPAANPLGLIAGIPTFNFAVFTADSLPLAPGTYKIGFACTLGGDTVSYWTGRIIVTADAGDPTGFTWAVTSPPPPTTPTSDQTSSSDASSSSEETASSEESSSSSSSSSSTSSSTSSTIASSSSSSSSVVVTSSTVQNVAAPVVATSTTTFAATLATTGASPFDAVMVAVLLLAFGRIVVLLARRPRVLPPGSR